jgi:hypothetical protein
MGHIPFGLKRGLFNQVLLMDRLTASRHSEIADSHR